MQIQNKIITLLEPDAWSTLKEAHFYTWKMLILDLGKGKMSMENSAAAANCFWLQ